MAAKKIIILLDNEAESLGSLNFAARHFKGSDFNLTVVIPEKTFLSAERSAIDGSGQGAAALQNNATPGFKDAVDALFEKKVTVLRFDDDCCSDIVKLCKYADVLLARWETFERWKGSLDSDEMRIGDFCTKVILPPSGGEISRIIFLNDGSDQNLYAVKKFCRLLGDQFKNLDVSLLETENALPGSEQKMLVDYLKTYFPNTAVHHFTGESPEKLYRYLEIDDNTLIVTGENPEKNFTEKYFPDGNVATVSNIS